MIQYYIFAGLRNNEQCSESQIMTQLKHSRRGTRAALLLQGKHPSLLLPWKGCFFQAHTAFVWLPCWLGEMLLCEASAEKWKRSRSCISNQSAGSAEWWSWCLAQPVMWRPWVRSPDGAGGKPGGELVVYVCCGPIWQGKLQEKAVWSRRTSSCPVVLFPGLFVSSQETVSLFLPVLCYCNFSCCWFRCWKSWLLVGTKKPKLKYSIPKTPQKQQCYTAHPFLLDKCQAVVKHNLSAL